jgi:hypothetical protein
MPRHDSREARPAYDQDPAEGTSREHGQAAAAGGERGAGQEGCDTDGDCYELEQGHLKGSVVELADKSY